MDLQGCTAVVTGASTGIGRVTAIALAQRGARVWAAARDLGRLEQLAAEQTGITPHRADVSVDADRTALVAAAGEIDLLVNNAGIGHYGLVESMTPEQVRALWETNVIGLIDLSQRVLPGMLARRRGHIVNVGSIAGFVAAPTETVYCATKHAVLAFTEGLRRELAGRGVDVTLIAPGVIKTEFKARARTGKPADVPGALDSGSSPDLVAKAIIRVVTAPHVPGRDVVTVPRYAGWSRLGALPGLAKATDRATRRRVQDALKGKQ